MEFNIEQLKKMQAQQLNKQYMKKARDQLAQQAKLRKEKNLLKQLANAKAARKLFGKTRIGKNYSGQNQPNFFGNLF